MLVYIAALAGLGATVVLAAVYAADRYEREPVARIQDCFLLGALAQLVAILAAELFAGPLLWAGPWLVLTALGTALFTPWHLARLPEMDERFDGIVYTVALAVGAGLAIHLNNLPLLAAASPHGGVLAEDAAPGLRDLLVIACGMGFRAELGRALAWIGIAVVLGAVLGVLHMRNCSPWRSSLIVGALATLLMALDVGSAGATWLRIIIVLGALVSAGMLKHRSIFKQRPASPEPEILRRSLKTVLIVFGTALLMTAILQGPASTHRLAGAQSKSEPPPFAAPTGLVP